MRNITLKVLNVQMHKQYWQHSNHEFVFMAHLMQTILGFATNLSHALKKWVKILLIQLNSLYWKKFQLQQLREDLGWDVFFKEWNLFCVKGNIKISDIDSFYWAAGRDKRFFMKIKNMHHFHVDMFKVSLTNNYKNLMKGLMR